jgi:hypothetical protein
VAAVREHDLVGSLGVQVHRVFIIKPEHKLYACTAYIADLHANQHFVVEIEILLVLALGVFRDECKPVLERIQAALHALFYPEIPRDPLKGKKMDEIHVLQEVGIPNRNRCPVFVDFPHP